MIFELIKEPCPYCLGHGDFYGTECQDCGGTGEVTVTDDEESGSDGR